MSSSAEAWPPLPGGAFLDGEDALLAFTRDGGLDDGFAWVPPLSGSALGGFRCLDASHGVVCCACSPAPSAEAMGSYELRGDAGRRNGEKRVKAALLRTREWHAAPAREAAAAAAAAAGLPRLAEALRAKRSTGLRKAELFFLLHHWRYASDLWADRVAAPPRCAAATPPPALPADAPPPAAADVARLLDGALRPALAALRTALGGEGARCAAAEAAAAGCAAETRAAARAALAALRTKASFVSDAWAAAAAAAAATAREHDALPPGIAAAARDAVRAPRRVVALLSMLQADMAHKVQKMPPGEARPGALTAVAEAWKGELLVGAGAALRAGAGAAATLARCWAQCDAREYLSCELAVAEWFVLVTSAVHAGMARRSEWLAELAQDALQGAAGMAESAEAAEAALPLFAVPQGPMDEHGVAAMLELAQQQQLLPLLPAPPLLAPPWAPAVA